MRSLGTLSAGVLLAAGGVQAGPVKRSAPVGATGDGLVSVMGPNNTRIGCVDKNFQWVTDDTFCDRFQVKMRYYNDESGVQGYSMHNSDDTPCHFGRRDGSIYCEESQGGGSWWRGENPRLPRDGDVIKGGAWGRGLPGDCELTPLYYRKLKNEDDYYVNLVWADTRKTGTTSTASGMGAMITPAPMKEDSTPTCTSTSTLPPQITHNVSLPIPWHAKSPGNLYVFQDEQPKGCLDATMAWTADETQCGRFTGYDGGNLDPHLIWLLSHNPYHTCFLPNEDTDYLNCGDSIDGGEMYKQGYYLVTKSLSKTWYASGVPTGSQTETITDHEGGQEVEIQWVFIDKSDN